MREIGLEIASGLMAVSDHTLEGGMRALAQLHHNNTAPAEILCSNDLTAVVVMHKAHKLGIVVPDDLSVVGFDDIRL